MPETWWWARRVPASRSAASRRERGKAWVADATIYRVRHVVLHRSSFPRKACVRLQMMSTLRGWRSPWAVTRLCWGSPNCGGCVLKGDTQPKLTPLPQDWPADACNPPHGEGERSSKGGSPPHRTPHQAGAGSGCFTCGANETGGGGSPGKSRSSFYNQMMLLLPSFCTCADSGVGSTACSQNRPRDPPGCALGDVFAWRSAASQTRAQGRGVRRSPAKPHYRVTVLPSSAGIVARSGRGTLWPAGSGQGEVEDPSLLRAAGAGAFGSGETWKDVGEAQPSEAGQEGLEWRTGDVLFETNLASLEPPCPPRPVARRRAPLALGRVWRGGEWAPPAGKPQPAPLPWPSRVRPPGRQPQGIWTPEVFGSGPAAALAQLLGLRGLLAAVGWERVELTAWLL